MFSFDRDGRCTRSANTPSDDVIFTTALLPNTGLPNTGFEISPWRKASRATDRSNTLSILAVTFEQGRFLIVILSRASQSTRETQQYRTGQKQCRRVTGPHPDRTAAPLFDVPPRPHSNRRQVGIVLSPARGLPDHSKKPAGQSQTNLSKAHATGSGQGWVPPCCTRTAGGFSQGLTPPSHHVG